MLASITGALGYLLLFAGVAERGRYALRPWDALTASNTPAADSGASSSSSSGGGGGVLGKIGGAVRSAGSFFLPGLP